MGDVGIRMYFIDEKKIIRIGLDTKKLFPKLAGKQVVWVTVTYHKGDPPRIMDIRLDPANIDDNGHWDREIQHKYAASVLDELFGDILGVKRDKKKVISLRKYINRVHLTDLQKELLKNRINRDFGKGTWENIPPKYKINLWSKGHLADWKND